MNYKISVKATKDIEDIWLYTFENWSIEQADRYANLIIDEIEYLAENPNSGKDFSNIRKNYRYSKMMSHIIFYKINVQKNKIEIIRILHKKMDLENWLNK